MLPLLSGLLGGYLGKGVLGGIFGDAETGTGKTGAQIGGGLLNYLPESALNAYADFKDADWNAIAKGEGLKESDFEMPAPPPGVDMSQAPVSIDSFAKMFGQQPKMRQRTPSAPILNKYLQGLLGGGV